MSMKCAMFLIWLSEKSREAADGDRRLN